MAGGRPPKYEDPQEMQRLVELYFLACKVKQNGETKALEDLADDDLEIVSGIDDVYPTVSGLALTLNLTRQGLIEYAEKQEFSDTVKRAKQKIESFLEQRLYGNAPTGTIFNLKNNFGWKDQKELELGGGLHITNADELSDDQLAAIAAGSSGKAAGQEKS